MHIEIPKGIENNDDIIYVHIDIISEQCDDCI